jgi:hypothetical protein
MKRNLFVYVAGIFLVGGFTLGGRIRSRLFGPQAKTPVAVVGSLEDEAAVWRAWFDERATLGRKHIAYGSTLTRTLLGRDVPTEAASDFAAKELARPEPGEKATSERMTELARRLRTAIRVQRAIPAATLSAGEPLLAPSEWVPSDTTCDTRFWSAFRHAHPGFDGIQFVSRVAFLDTLAVFYASDIAYSSESQELVLMKLINGKWRRTASTAETEARAECPPPWANGGPG